MESHFENYYIQPKSGYEYYPADVCQISNHKKELTNIGFEYLSECGDGIKDFMEIRSTPNGSTQMAYIEEGSGYEYNDNSPLVAYHEITQCSQGVWKTSHKNKMKLTGRYNEDAAYDNSLQRPQAFGLANRHTWRSRHHQNNKYRKYSRHNSSHRNIYHNRYSPILDLTNIDLNFVNIYIEMKKFFINSSRNGSRRVHLRVGLNPTIRSEVSHYLNRKMYSFRFINYQLIIVYL